MREYTRLNRPALTLLVSVGCARLAAGAPIPDYDFQWATVTHAGNAGFPGTSPYTGSFYTGRGAVPYEYRISKLEITSAQWGEFYNAAAPLSAAIAAEIRPGLSGGQVDPTTGRFELFAPETGTHPVAGVTWRAAAMFCNWLCNDKVSTLAALSSGAYDAATFTDNYNEFGSRVSFNDQAAHTPGARFWIPTLDEWIKAAHYDPNRFGPGQGGWWLGPNMKDHLPIGGPPPELVGSEFGETLGEANINILLGFGIPVGSYEDQVSPWGLLDTAGSEGEWLEEIENFAVGQRRFRMVEGTRFTDDWQSVADWVHASAPGRLPYARGATLRIASSVPAPGHGWLVAVLASCARRPRRLSTCAGWHGYDSLSVFMRATGSARFGAVPVLRA